MLVRLSRPISYNIYMPWARLGYFCSGGRSSLFFGGGCRSRTLSTSIPFRSIPFRSFPCYSTHFQGNFLLSGSSDKSAIVWDVARGDVQQQFRFHEAPTLVRFTQWVRLFGLSFCRFPDCAYVCLHPFKRTRLHAIKLRIIHRRDQLVYLMLPVKCI